ncbi:phage terminase small subunit [Listeria fleischmannii]|uniref:Phage terminase small subunit n=1 Tax=Listeria fleischmannii FSL S10-1203 TaxID=1265822 RepID=W7DIL4_9LIST|nr:phage terminase small subunit [Listeria fleischmannii]EUJ64729.1 phage terminase small subunit [Listeria fleischmannii FSL S10-1203]
MARQRSPDRDKAFELFKKHNGNIQNREIANQLGVSEKTISGWKSKDGWNGVLQKKERSTPKKRGAPIGNKNAVGNEGGAPERNDNATKHGLFAKYVPEETAAIMESLEDISGREILWGNIKMQYAAIIRAQRIMWVDDSEDDLEKASSESWGQDGGGQNRKLIYAYERYATFLSSQSRAMGTLTTLIKQYLALDPEGERAKQLEVMDATISKLKAEANAESDTALTTITFVEDVPAHD